MEHTAEYSEILKYQNNFKNATDEHFLSIEIKFWDSARGFL